MRRVKLALEEGFLDDHVRVTVDGRELVDLEKLSTRVQVGLARMIEVDLEGDEGELTIELPDKGTRTAITLAGDAPAYVGVSVAEDGQSLDVRRGEAPLGYV